jgi:hypothetical protein
MAVLIASAKELQLLHEIAPAVRRVGRLAYAANRPGGDRQAAWETFAVERMKTEAAAVGIEPIRMPVLTLGEAEAKLAELAGGGAAGVLVLQDATLFSPEWRPPLMEMALKHRLPTCCQQSRLWAEAGW